MVIRYRRLCWDASHPSNIHLSLPAAAVGNSCYLAAFHLKYLQLSASLSEVFLPHPWESEPRSTRNLISQEKILSQRDRHQWTNTPASIPGTDNSELCSTEFLSESPATAPAVGHSRMHSFCVSVFPSHFLQPLIGLLGIIFYINDPPPKSLSQGLPFRRILTKREGDNLS